MILLIFYYLTYLLSINHSILLGVFDLFTCHLLIVTSLLPSLSGVLLWDITLLRNDLFAMMLMRTNSKSPEM